MGTHTDDEGWKAELDESERARRQTSGPGHVVPAYAGVFRGAASRS